MKHEGRSRRTSLSSHSLVAMVVEENHPERMQAQCRPDLVTAACRSLDSVPGISFL